MSVGLKSDEQIDFWSKSVHDKHFLSQSIPSPSGLGVPSLLDQTISNLSSKLSDLIAHVETKHADKVKSKNKFDNLDENMKVMVLNSSTKSTEFSASEPVDTLKQIIECPTAAKSQSRLNQMLHLKNAYKISILFLGKNINVKQFKSSSREQLLIHF